jgi:Protein of unknown function (DUF2442)
LNRSNAFKEPTVIKVLTLEPAEGFDLILTFSNGTRGRFDGAAYLAAHRGPLLEPLRQTGAFRRCFVEAGAVCWPNGLELSGARMFELSHLVSLAA